MLAEASELSSLGDFPFLANFSNFLYIPSPFLYLVLFRCPWICDFLSQPTSSHSHSKFTILFHFSTQGVTLLIVSIVNIPSHEEIGNAAASLIGRSQTLFKPRALNTALNFNHIVY
jgi:hypothetical protein